jgi:tryptophanyl-tRNA synthetase
MNRVFSGVQPTGNLHLGNYLGAIRQWVLMQEAYECLFCVVDLHAITVPQDPVALVRATREVTAAYIACGIDPARCVIFPQSSVSLHSELAWVLSCHTPLGWLNRMTQFKEKSGKRQDQASLGLYSYPVLMAADILAYKATHVPVGEDQKQHLELARDIAGAFNRQYGQDYFPLPEPLIQASASRIMSLRDGRKKMSKSDASDYARINLTDDADMIALKIRKAKSDAIAGMGYDPEARPEAANLLSIYAALEGMTPQEAGERHADKDFSSFKHLLAELAVTNLAPITRRMRELMEDPGHIDAVLKAGAEKARVIADRHWREIKEIVGLSRF